VCIEDEVHNKWKYLRSKYSDEIKEESALKSGMAGQQRVSSSEKTIIDLIDVGFYVGYGPGYGSAPYKLTPIFSIDKINK